MKTVEHIKQGLMNHTSGSMGDRAEEHNLNCEDMAKDILEEKNISKWHKDCFYDVLTKKVAAFCPCPVHLHEITLKSLQLMTMAEEISRQQCLD